MLSSEVLGAGWKLKLLAAGLGLGLLTGCQARPLYGSEAGKNLSVSVSPAGSRVEQVVRNELVLQLGGETADPVYRLELSASAGTGGILPGGLDNEFSAARTTVSAKYVLKTVATGETLKSGSRFADAQLDLPSQQFAQERAKIEAENRAARSVAALVQADIVSALTR